MSGSPLEAVARVLRSHVSSFDEAGQAYQREWADRAAAAVVAALELREERQTVENVAGWLTHPGTTRGDVMVRLVSSWRSDR